MAVETSDKGIIMCNKYNKNNNENRNENNCEKKYEKNSKNDIGTNNVINDELKNEVILKYTGKVVTGNRIGRTISIPTVNVPVNTDISLPEFGVYVARLSYIEGKMSEQSHNGNSVILHGVANIGVKPSIPNSLGKNPVGIEVNLFDYSGNLYDREVTVELLSFIRKEMKFDSIEKLKNQINKDVAIARKILSQCDYNHVCNNQD